MTMKPEPREVYTEILSMDSSSLFYLNEASSRADVCLIGDASKTRGTLLVSSERRHEAHVLSYESLVENVARMSGFKYDTRYTDAAEIANLNRSKAAESKTDVLRQQEVLAYIREGSGQHATEMRIIVERDHGLIRYKVRGEAHSKPKITRDHAEALARSLYTSMTVDSGIQLNMKIYQDAKLRPEFAEKANLSGSRISTYPLDHGGVVVTLRLLPKEGASAKSFESAGYHPSQREAFRRLIRRRRGVFVVTGVTGSGKSTFAKMFLEARAEYYDHKQDTFTLENPVEYDLNGPSIFQGPLVVDHQDETDIAPAWRRGLRALMRQAPNTIMPGEARDKESSAFVFDVAQTGHFALTTFHTATPDAALARFEHEMGVHPNLLLDPSNTIAILNQDLVRTICPDCKAPLKDHWALIPDEDRARYEQYLNVETACVGLGCDACGHSGSTDRIVAAELVETTVGYMNAYRKDGATGARLHFVNEMQGMTKIMHMRQHINAGLVDPRHAERDVEPLDLDTLTLGIGPEVGGFTAGRKVVAPEVAHAA